MVSHRKWTKIYGQPCIPYLTIIFIIFQDEFKRVITCVEDSILATDLAVYFRRRRETFDLVDANSVDFNSDHHRYVKISFSKIKGFDNFVIDNILSNLKHCHH